MITIDRSSAQTTSEQTGGALTGLTEASRNSSQNGSPPPIPPLPEFELQPNKGTFVSSPSFTYDLHIDTEATYLPSPQDIMGCYYLLDKVAALAKLNSTYLNTLKSILIGNISQERFWHSHENENIETMSTIPLNL